MLNGKKAKIWPDPSSALAQSIKNRLLFAILLALLVACAQDGPMPEQAQAASPTSSNTPMPAFSPAATMTPAPTRTADPTPTPTIIPPATATPTDTAVPTPISTGELKQTRWTRVQHSSFFSQSRQEMIEFTIFTPPGYEDGNGRYPVIYFLHGASGSEILFWNGITREVPEANGDAGAWLAQLITDGLIPAVIVVAADDTNGLWGRENEVMVTQEWVAYIDANWRTIRGKEGRAITGFSMGGYGTALYAARHFDQYCTALVMSLGGRDDYLRAWSENQAQIVSDGLQVGLLVGGNDRRGLRDTTQMHETLESLAIAHSFLVVPDVGHNFGQLYSRAGLDALQFLTRCFTQ